MAQGARSGTPGRARANPRPAGGAVLAFDFGERRTGVAVGDRSLRIAHPLETIEAATEPGRMSRIDKLVREWDPALFVVGLPVSADGSQHPLAARVRAFARTLAARFGRPVELMDERFSSSEASLVLREAGVRGQSQKAHLDSFAAKTILEDFFAHDDPAA